LVVGQWSKAKTEMGSFHQWAHGIWFGLFLGLIMSTYNIGQRPSISLRKTVFTTVCSCVLLQFSFGLWESFGPQAFRSPIVFVTIPSGICGLFIAWAGRSAAREKQQNDD
jgi:hypothetical protein